MRVTASVPARINIIGEHTDHFGGLSLTFSSQHRLELTATKREGASRGINRNQPLGGRRRLERGPRCRFKHPDRGGPVIICSPLRRNRDVLPEQEWPDGDLPRGPED